MSGRHDRHGPGGIVEHGFHPVFPPDRNAADVVAWLAARA